MSIRAAAGPSRPAPQSRGGASELELGEGKPGVVLVVGVNGGGKTTTIGKIANKFGSEGAKVSLGVGCGTGGCMC